MTLNKYKLGDLIEKSDLKNKNNEYTSSDVRGISINKCFSSSKADVDNINLSLFKVVKPGYFAFNTATSRNGEKISIAYNNTNDTYIISSLYDVFKLNEFGKKVLNEEYLYMFFNRQEFDRYARCDSWGSAREYFRYSNMCDVDILLPPKNVQDKYVKLYNEIKKNYQSFAKVQSVLEKTCNIYIEDLKKKYPSIEIGQYIKRYSEKNSNGIVTKVVGLSTKKEFREPQSRVNKNELKSYKVLHNNDIAYVPTTDTWKVLAFAVNHFNKDVVVSPIYEVFTVDNRKLLTDYLALWLRRKEFDRYARYNSWGSARENFSFDEMCNVKIPIPNIEIQQDIVNIYNAYSIQKNISEKLNNYTQYLCPILIRGSLLEESR